MLGIGFIIAHFVAMQKPQQRKYHSSCNRSVHRGTAHGKQRVKVCKRKTPHLFLMRSFFAPLRGWYLCQWAPITSRRDFRPLTGIVPSTPSFQVGNAGFSSPYGDCTTEKAKCANTGLFSPPCGDCTSSSLIMDGILLFSPPYGDGTATFDIETTNTEFSPPYGDGIEYYISVVVPGMFSPPCGDRTYIKHPKTFLSEFSPPLRGWY